MGKEIISVMKRYELKYRLSKEQVLYFKDKVQEYMKIDKYGLTTISSIYYDTPDFTLINRSIEKPLYKEKIRLRSYGIAKEDSPVFLEIKRKHEKIVYKRRIVSKEDKVEGFFQNGEEFGDDQISRELDAFKEKYGVLEPKYIVIYDRIAYYQDDSDVRITLDMNPRYRTSDLNLHTSTEGISLLEEGEAILEVKVQHSIPLWLVKILTDGKIYQSSFSKVGTSHRLEMAKKSKPKLVSRQFATIKGGYQYGLAI